MAITATDKFDRGQFSPRIDWPAGSAETITPSDTDELHLVTRALYVGGTGDVTVTMHDPDSHDVTVTFTAVPAGTVLPIRVKQVKATGTTATALVGLS